jgi:ATP synthase F1 delta subunit
MKRNGNTTSTRYVERRVTVIARASVAPPPVVVVVAHALFVSFSPQPPLNLFGLPARYASAVYTAASKEGVLERVQSEIKTVRALGTPPTPRRGANSGASDRPRRERSERNLVRLDFVVWSVFLLPARLPPRVSDPLFLPPPLSVHAQLVDAANMDEKFRNFLYDPTMPKAKKIAGITEFCDGAGFDKITKSFLCVTAENGRLKETSKILGCLEEYSLKAAGQVKATVTSAFPLNEDQLTRLTGLIKKKLDDPEDELTVETKVDSKLVGGFTVAMGEDFYDLSLMTRLRHMENELAKPLR